MHLRTTVKCLPGKPFPLNVIRTHVFSLQKKENPWNQFLYGEKKIIGPLRWMMYFWQTDSIFKFPQTLSFYILNTIQLFINIFASIIIGIHSVVLIEYAVKSSIQSVTQSWKCNHKPQNSLGTTQSFANNKTVLVILLRSCFLLSQVLVYGTPKRCRIIQSNRQLIQDCRGMLKLLNLT